MDKNDGLCIDWSSCGHRIIYPSKYLLSIEMFNLCKVYLTSSKLDISTYSSIQKTIIQKISRHSTIKRNNA